MYCAIRNPRLLSELIQEATCCILVIISKLKQFIQGSRFCGRNDHDDKSLLDTVQERSDSHSRLF
jgi:hypothetical protein